MVARGNISVLLKTEKAGGIMRNLFREKRVHCHEIRTPHKVAIANKAEICYNELNTKTGILTCEGAYEGK